ncbi:hypothetical protein RDABS01_033036 [Bienertia sinuspersici]
MSSNVNITTMETAEDNHLQIRQWADLPKDVLFRIILYADMKVDVPRVRGVCTSWRSALPLSELPAREPHIQVPSLGEGNNLPPLFLLESIFYFISPLSSSAGGSNCGGWIARVGETGTNKWHLLNPLKNDHSPYEHDIKYLYTEPPISGVINLLDCRVFELARSMSLVHKFDYRNAKDISNKVVGGWDFASSYLFAALVHLEQKQDGVQGDLLLWRLGDQQWLKIMATDDTSLRVLEIAFHNGKFYIFEVMSNIQWGVRVLNPGDSSMSQLFINGPDILLPAQDSPLMFGVDGDSYALWGGVYLMPSKSKSCLYLVIDGVAFRRDTNKLIRKMIVYLMKEDEEIKWERVENLRNEIFFLGSYISFVLPSSAQNLPQWRHNSICSFSNNRNVQWYEVHYKTQGGDRRMPEGVECLERVHYPSYKRYLSLFIMDENEKGVVPFDEMPEDEDVYTGVFFPPPAWVKWHCPSLNNGEVRLDGLGFRDPNADDDDDW